MAENKNAVKVEKDNKVKKFFKSEKVKKCIHIGAHVGEALAIIAYGAFLVIACSSSEVEAEVNADVIDQYNAMKMEVNPDTAAEIVNS